MQLQLNSWVLFHSGELIWQVWDKPQLWQQSRRPLGLFNIVSSELMSWKIVHCLSTVDWADVANSILWNVISERLSAAHCFSWLESLLSPAPREHFPHWSWSCRKMSAAELGESQLGWGGFAKRGFGKFYGNSWNLSCKLNSKGKAFEKTLRKVKIKY